MTLEELLQPRRRVMIKYPRSPFEVGEILELNKIEEINEEWCDQFPEIFKRVEWWEDRKVEDMPEYLKHNVTGEVKKSYKHFTYITVEGSMKGEHEAKAVCSLKELHSNGYEHLFWRYNLCIPATLEDYTQYINKR